VKLTEIDYCEQWSVISNKQGFEASALMVSGRDHTIFYCAHIIIFMHVYTERIKTVNVQELGIGLVISPCDGRSIHWHPSRWGWYSCL